MGPSGSGKSTLISLITRLFDTSSGEIQINKENINNLKLKNLRSFFSLVSQDTVLFDGSIEENIAYNSKVNKITIQKISKTSCLDEFINTLPSKLKTKIGENGIKLSGGQRQRISFARALAQNNPVMLLDEPTSNLDLKTESQLFSNIYKIKNITLIVVAHRLSTIKNFDEIYFLEKGKIIEKGSHEYLMKIKGKYFQLYQKQLKK